MSLRTKRVGAGAVRGIMACACACAFKCMKQIHAWTKVYLLSYKPEYQSDDGKQVKIAT